MFGFGFGGGGSMFGMPNSRELSRGFSSSIGEIGNALGASFGGAEQQQGTQSALGGAQQQAMSAEMMDSAMGQASSFFGGGGGGLWNSSSPVEGDASKWSQMAGQLGGAVAGGSLGKMFGFGGGGSGDWSRGNSALPMQTSELQSRQVDILGGTEPDMAGAAQAAGQAALGYGGGGGGQAATAEAAPTQEAISSAMSQASSSFESISGIFGLGGKRRSSVSSAMGNPVGEGSEAIAAAGGEISDFLRKAFDWGGGSPFGGSSFGGKVKKEANRVSKKLKQFFSW